MGLPKSGIVASVRPLTGCISLSRDVWFVRLLVWKMHGDAPPPPPLLKMQLHYTLCSQTASLCNVHSLCLALYLSCWWYTLTVQHLWVERSSVIKFGISSAGRPQPSDQQSNPYKSQSEPFLGQIHHLHFQNQTQYSGALKASTSGRIASWKVFADMGGDCKEIKFLADYSQLNSCHLLGDDFFAKWQRYRVHILRDERVVLC